MVRKATWEDPPSVKDIERGLATISRIVLLYGDRYLPILYLLESALEEAKARQSTMQRVREYAKRDT
jgi:hypothetical protein